MRIKYKTRQKKYIICIISFKIVKKSIIKWEFPIVKSFTEKELTNHTFTKYLHLVKENFGLQNF